MNGVALTSHEGWHSGFCVFCCGQFTSSGRVEILLGDAQYSVLVVAPDPASGEYAAEDQRLSDKLGSPVLAMAVSPNGRCVLL